jgi:hypothetical protein
MDDSGPLRYGERRLRVNFIYPSRRLQTLCREIQLFVDIEGFEGFEAVQYHAASNGWEARDKPKIACPSVPGEPCDEFLARI